MNENKVRDEILQRYGHRLERMADEYGLSGSTLQSRQLEALSRYTTEKVLFDIDTAVTVFHHPQLATLDATITSGGTEIPLETKVRYVSSGDYDTCDVSKPKIDALREQNGLLLVFYWGDKTYAVYDVTKCHPSTGQWYKSHYTVNDQRRNYKELEECYKFDPAEAKFRGTL